MKKTDGILHEPGSLGQPRFVSGQIYSMLDIFGGGTATCDQCGRYQRFTALLESDAREVLAKTGWQTIDGQDLCPICAKAKGEA